MRGGIENLPEKPDEHVAPTPKEANTAPNKAPAPREAGTKLHEAFLKNIEERMNAILRHEPSSQLKMMQLQKLHDELISIFVETMERDPHDEWKNGDKKTVLELVRLNGKIPGNIMVWHPTLAGFSNMASRIRLDIAVLKLGDEPPKKIKKLD